MLSDGFHGIPAGKVAMIVTYLEMRTPPPLTERPLPPDLAFRQVDADTVWFRDIFTRVGSLNWLWYGRLKLNDADLGVIVQNPKVEHYTLSKDGTDEALLELDFRVDGVCELAYFGLTRELIGTGAGRFLMNQAIARAWAQPISLFHVHTCTIDSPQALDFYRRSGFTPVKQEVEIDDDPRILGILPRSAGPNIPIFTP